MKNVEKGAYKENRSKIDCAVTDGIVINMKNKLNMYTKGWSEGGKEICETRPYFLRIKWYHPTLF